MRKYLKIIQFEFSRKSKGMIVWIIGWSFFIALILGFYDSLAANTKELELLISSLPPQLLKAFNIDTSSLSTLEGMFNSRFTTFSVIIGGIWSGWLGAQMIGKDESTGSLTWLATQPVSRAAIYFSKLVSSISWILIVNMALMFIAIVQSELLTSVTNIPVKFFIQIGIGLSIYYILLLVIGNLAAILLREEKGRYIAIFTVMISYSMNVVRAFEGSPEIVKYLTLNYYFNPDRIATTGEIGPEIFILIVLIVIISAIGIFFFQNKSIGD